VDMARMKIEFLAEHKKRHGFTRRDKLVAHLPRYAHVAARLQPLSTLFMSLPGARALVEKMVGFDARRALPKFERAWTARARTRDTRRERQVVLFADTFNNWFEPENLQAALKVLEATGHEVIVATAPDKRPLCCGRTYLTTGMVDEARNEAKRTMEALKPHLGAGIPVLGLEPSCLFTFRDEYAAMFPDDKTAAALARAMLVDEYLAAEIAAGRIQPPWRKSAGALKVHGHCHQKAFAAFDATLALLRTLPDTKVEAIESSCCGMAGSFGHEHYDVSMKMGELALLPAVRAAPDATIVASGTSCRQQVAHGAAREAKHPIVVLAEAL